MFIHQARPEWIAFQFSPDQVAVIHFALRVTIFWKESTKKCGQHGQSLEEPLQKQGVISAPCPSNQHSQNTAFTSLYDCTSCLSF